MKEAFLHYIWVHKLYNPSELITTGNEAVEIIDNGLPNHDAGPDFFNAKIKIGDTLWAGNVEIHSTSSDWTKHKHHQDKAYDSVILHVVGQVDTDIYRIDGSKIPQVIITVPKYLQDNYEELHNNTNRIACDSKLTDFPNILLESWKNALLTERLQEKTKRIEDILAETKEDWEEAFYITLASNFGFGKNNQPMELLAKSIPLKVFGKHKNNLTQIEAILFGQSGLFPANTNNTYVESLKKEYEFLRVKFDLKPTLESSNWKMMRLRPDNFPYTRIAQFASLIHSSSKLFSKIIENPDIEYLKTLFTCEPADFWKTHYTFESEATKIRTGRLGEQSVYIILINTVIPFLFHYANKKNNQELKDKAISLLENIPAEKNAITDDWADIGIKCKSAFDSQALIQLRKQYCDQKKCIRCRIGHKVLTTK